VQIYGERCSGTNYIANLIQENFDVELTKKYGHKHFFGFECKEKMKKANDTLFVCIVRDPIDWLNSLYKTPHHLINRNTITLKNFLNCKVVSFRRNGNAFNQCRQEKAFINENGDRTYKDGGLVTNNTYQGNEIYKDRNMFTDRKFESILELRHAKLRFFFKIMPKLVENCIIVKYEDFLKKFRRTMNTIKYKGLKVRNNIIYPVNIYYYKQSKDMIFFKNHSEKKLITKDMVVNHKDFNETYEKRLGYF
jgi:hypothetical protein